MATDLVCKMQVDEKNARYKSTHMGQTYYFCSAGCKNEFDRNPMKYMT